MLRRARSVVSSATGVLLLSGLVAAGGPRRTTALQPQGSGEIVHDANLDVYWLANANLAADSAVRADMGVAGIQPNGMMDFPTALKWVAALNAYHKGEGWLGHHDWQLPSTPVLDSTCGAKGPQGASFGGLCDHDALGNLYYAGLRQALSDNVAPGFGAALGPLRNLQIAYYWTAAQGGLHGTKVFSFAAADSDATTTNDSWYYVLPMVKRAIGAHASCDAGGLVPYTGGPAAGHAVYDCSAQVTWPTDANLAATVPNGITRDVWVVERRPFPRRTGNGLRIKTKPIVGGAMLFATAGEWVAALDSMDNGAGQPKGYLGSSQWQLPDAPTDLGTLYAHLSPTSRDVGGLQSTGRVGAFRNLQPFFYWELCIPQALDYQLEPQAAQSCADGNAPPGRRGNQMNYDFTFGYGIKGTDLFSLKYFVMVYYPGPNARPPLPTPNTPMGRCLAAGGTWINGRCE